VHVVVPVDAPVVAGRTRRMAIAAEDGALFQRLVAADALGVVGHHRRRPVFALVHLLRHRHEEVRLDQEVVVILDLVAGGAGAGIGRALAFLVVADLAVGDFLHPRVLLVIPDDVADPGPDRLIRLAPRAHQGSRGADGDQEPSQGDE